MARVRNRTGQARVIPEAGGRIVGDDEVFDVADDRAEEWAKQPGFEVEDGGEPAHRRTHATRRKPADEEE